MGLFSGISNHLFSFTAKGLFVLLLCSHIDLFPQAMYQKNAHVVIKSKQSRAFFKISFSFKDQFNQKRELEIEYSRPYTDKMISRFGIPKSYFLPYTVTPEVVEEREKRIRYGLFRQTGQVLEVDKSAVVRFYSEPFCKPIADHIIKTLKNENRDTRENRIEFAMSLVQDIPYGVPEPEDSLIYNGGILVPPEVLIKGYGDCDSKTLLFTSILVHLINPDDIVFLGQQGHLLTAIRTSQVKPGMYYYELDNDKFAIAETAGPGRRRWGEKGSNTQGAANVERLQVHNGHAEADLPETALGKAALADTKKFETIEFNNSGNNNNTGECFEVIARNNTSDIVYLLLKYKDLSGIWQTRGWYKTAPGSEQLLAKTYNKYVYFYGVSDQGEWRGNHPVIFEHEEYMLYEVFVDSEVFGTITVLLSK